VAEAWGAHFLNFQVNSSGLIIQTFERTQFETVQATVNSTNIQNFFSQRAIDTWNKLPSDVISSRSVNMFKNKLDDHWNDVGVKSY